MKTLRFVFLSACALALLAPVASRGEDDARTLMDKVLHASGFQDMQGEITLTLKNKRGDTKVRRIAMSSKKSEQGESRMIMRFVEPADVRGTAFLLIEHEGAEDDRRLWLPALRRVQRISTSGAGGNFMSSDFTYYDIGRPKLEDWTFSDGGESTVQGTACRVVKGQAASDKVKGDTGYAAVHWCVDPERLVILGADYFDKDGEPLKTLVAKKIEDVGGTPFATEMEMTDAHTGHASRMVFEKLKIDQGLSEDLFTERRLRRAR